MHNNRYHHVDCLVNKAQAGIESGKHIATWEKILNNIPKLQEEAKKKLCHKANRDDFNMFILEQYEVSKLPESFWRVIEQIGHGDYKQKKCQPTDVDELHAAWKWSMPNLKRIAANNKANNRGPQNEWQRINYDLAIVLSHINDFKKEQAKKEMNIQEARSNASFDELDMSKIGQKKTEKKEDVSDIFNDFFS